MDGFFRAWMDLLLSLREPDDYRLAAEACGRELAARNARYIELHLSVAGAHRAGRLNAHEVIPAVARGLEAARAAGGPRWRLIVDVIRELVVEGAGDVGLEIARRHRADGVAAVGLGGNEGRHPASAARDILLAARSEGLGVTVHAGEAAGPESIRAALEAGAQRIGHATTAPRDPALVAQLASENVPLEMCPTSNVITGAAASLAAHPVGPLLRRGLNVSLNTDDPAFFNTTLDAEYRAVAAAHRLTEREAARLARNAFAAAFLPAEKRDDLLARFDAEVAAL